MAKKNTLEEYLNNLYELGLGGDEEAQLEFIRFYVTETDIPLPDEAQGWLRALAEKGNDQARRCYFSMAISGDGGTHDWKKLEQWVLDTMESAPAEAHCMLGMLYEPGLPGFSDAKKAAEHYRHAMECGNVGCGLYLARTYVRHEPEEHSPEELRELLEAAEKVNPCGYLYFLLATACDDLGDDDAAIRYYKKWHKLEPDNPDCSKAIASHYAMGQGVNQNYEIAMRYYQKAANQHDAEALFILGAMYYVGHGTRRNDKRAVDYFTRALEQGNTRSLYYLGKLYLCGKGIRADEEKSLSYIKQGIEIEDAWCYVSMADCYTNGIGVEQDFDKAAEWLDKAEALMEGNDDEDLDMYLADCRADLQSLREEAEEISE